MWIGGLLNEYCLKSGSVDDPGGQLVSNRVVGRQVFDDLDLILQILHTADLFNPLDDFGVLVHDVPELELRQRDHARQRHHPIPHVAVDVVEHRVVRIALQRLPHLLRELGVALPLRDRDRRPDLGDALELSRKIDNLIFVPQRLQHAVERDDVALDADRHAPTGHLEVADLALDLRFQLGVV